MVIVFVVLDSFEVLYMYVFGIIMYIDCDLFYVVLDMVDEMVWVVGLFVIVMFEIVYLWG